MLKKICRECGAEMARRYNLEGTFFFCETCDRETEYDNIEMEPFCPECGARLEVCQKCGTGYFCDTCNALKSSKRVIWKKESF